METSVATARKVIELLTGIMKPTSEGGLLLFMPDDNQVFFNSVDTPDRISYMYIHGHWGILDLAEDCRELGQNLAEWGQILNYPATPYQLEKIKTIIANG